MARRASPLRFKRVYDTPHKDDGFRVLVDRLWPRGLSKDVAKIDLWAKALAPSDALRKIVHAEPGYPDEDAVWRRFVEAYRTEFGVAAATDDGAAALDAIRTARAKGPVTLLFALRNDNRNNAVALAVFLG